ncbi:MAG: hypothetical protein VR73_03375 [Gammaproteobacteria bacterium BRH_c0]|nr:MAG: hypothetical protein VR73_03375 [Gammaproteobacteria bacterium BRH_c0]
MHTHRQIWLDEQKKLMSFCATGVNGETSAENCQAPSLVRFTVGQGTGVEKTLLMLTTIDHQPAVVLPDNDCHRYSGQKPDLIDMLRTLDERFGFNVSDLARILRVERKTVYLWKANPDTEVQHAKRERLQLLLDLSSTWANLSSKPLVWARHECPKALNGNSLLEYLSRETLDKNLLEDIFGQLALRIDELAKAVRKGQNDAIKVAATRTRLPDSDEIAAKLKARLAQQQATSVSYTTDTSDQ